ncbi:MAG: amidohydrolase family protein [Kiritimatiellae bacterium]|nr:amidohydrolase family protein [Kiritimatiellia bacterium]
MNTSGYLVRQEHVPPKARFPVIDAHNHLWGAWDEVARIVGVMDQVGVLCYCDLTANIDLEWGGGGYRFRPGDIRAFFTHAAGAYPGRFYGFTTATFARPVDQPLFEDAGAFVRETIETLREHVALGARGLKILKELGLRYRDAAGQRVRIDDPRLAPVWEEAGRLGVPVLMHQSDPVGFFEPVTPKNEHYDSLMKYPSWSFADPDFPRKHELLEQRDRVIRNHPNTTFMLPHVANCAEDLSSVARLLDHNPNVYIDCSARADELGRRPYAARRFLIDYQDRVYFGTDMPASPDMYRFYFRFFETDDEYFFPPDYDGTFERHRWHVCGLALPDEVLQKLYSGNILRIVPGLRKWVRGVV